MISVYSFVMAVLWFSIAALIGSIVLRNTTKGGLVFTVVIFLLAFFRMFVPLDFEGSAIIRSEYCYPFLQSIVRKTVMGRVTVGILLLIIWFVGAVVRLVLLVRKLIILHRFLKHLPKECTGSKMNALIQTVTKAFHYTGEVDLAVSGNGCTAYQAGYVRPFILLPKDTEKYSNEQICHMIRHELCHFLGKDLWIKTGFQLLACLFWWNPVMLLLGKSIEHMLELRCDQRACTQLTRAEQLSYLDTLLLLAKNNSSKSASLPLNYIGIHEDHNITHRFKLILDEKKQTFLNAKVICGVIICVVLFMASYSIIIQPWNAPPVEETSIEASSATSSFIIHTSDDQYDLYFDGVYVGTLSEEMLEHEPFCDYVIYEGGIFE